MRFWCIHHWEITAVQPIDIYPEFGGTRPIRSTTEVSMVCKKCGWPRVHTMRGNWIPS